MINTRSIIHEGLSWLAIRQVQAGERRHSSVLRHLTSLTQIAPSHFDFSFRAGNWALEPQLMKIPEAINFYHNCLYGKASNYTKIISNNETDANNENDKKTNKNKNSKAKDNSNVKEIPKDQDIYLARREYARALALNGQNNEAIAELIQLLSNKVIDFGAAFRLRSLIASSNGNDIDINHEAAKNILSKYDVFYSDILSVSSNNYTGFIPSNNWKPEKYTILPSVNMFNDYIQRREPMIISLGSWLDYSLGWKTNKWNNNDKKNDDESNYLLNLIGNDMILVELVNNSISRNGNTMKINDTNDTKNKKNKILFGFGSEAQRKIISFKSFLESYNDNNGGELKDYLVYLNIQGGSDHSNNDIYKPPLHKLKDDIPIPTFLKDAWNNITAVNLWMGNSYEGPTTSRLHMDAMDNLYVVLKGHKDFIVYPPNLSNHMRTISPTISISPNGHSFQYKGPNNSNNGNKSNTIKNNYLKDHKYIDYDKEKYHFSYISSIDDPLLGQALGQEKRFSLKPGDILYLPAGWFHQVTSSEGQHQAINYWWKPPQWENAVKFEKQSLKQVNKKLNRIVSSENNKNIHHSEL